MYHGISWIYAAHVSVIAFRKGMVVGVAFVYAPVHDDVAVCHAGDDRHLVAYKHDGVLFGKILHHRVDLALESLVYIAQWFVKHYHLRTGYECASQKSALKLTAGKDTDSAVKIIANAAKLDDTLKILFVLLAPAGEQPFDLSGFDGFSYSDRKPRVDIAFLGKITYSKTFRLLSFMIVGYLS